MNHLAALPVPYPALAVASIRTQAGVPGPGSVPPLPPDVVPPPLDIPPDVPPEIREPDQPGEHIPISDDPNFPPTPTRR